MDSWDHPQNPGNGCRELPYTFKRETDFRTLSGTGGELGCTFKRKEPSSPSIRPGLFLSAPVCDPPSSNKITQKGNDSDQDLLRPWLLPGGEV